MISTMNTRTGNAQSRGVSQIELEEDAMLTAIGQSSLDEMADKYADRWEDFMQSLSRWRSIHQLFRLSQLNKTIQNLITLEMSQKQTEKTLRRLKGSLLGSFSAQHRYDIMIQNNIKQFQRVVALSEKSAFEKKIYPIGFQNPKTKKWENRTIDDWRKIFQEREDWIKQRKEATFMKRAGIEIEQNQNQRALNETRAELQKTQDQYDITKPYAMGLLVADIFYTLASAIQGEIYL